MSRGGCERAALAVRPGCVRQDIATTSPGADAGTGGTRSAGASAAIDFDIPSQPMAAALNSWAVQANAQVFVDPGPVAHLIAPAVKGS